MPLQPSRRDTTSTTDLTRHHQSYLRSLDPGYLDGRYATPQPVTDKVSQVVGGDSGGEGPDDTTVIGEDGDRYIVTSLTNPPPWTLSYTPVAETIVVRWHPDGAAGVEWKRGEHYTIDDDDNVITITAEALAAAKAQVDDVFSAQYLRTDGEQVAMTELESVILRGNSLVIDHPTTIPLPDGTEIGDLIVVANATLHFTGGPGTGTVDDPRMTQVGHGAWIGIATDLSPVQFANPGGDRHTGTVATFVGPLSTGSVASTGPSGGGVGTLAAPVVSALGAILVATLEAPNGVGVSEITGVPAGYLNAAGPYSAATICCTGIWYWQPDGGSTSPSGVISYDGHLSAETYATAISLEGSEGA